MTITEDQAEDKRNAEYDSKNQADAEYNEEDRNFSQPESLSGNKPVFNFAGQPLLLDTSINDVNLHRTFAYGDIQESPLSIQDALDFTFLKENSGMQLFIETIHSHNDGREIITTIYDMAHSVAKCFFYQLFDEVYDEYGGTLRCFIKHFRGELRPGDISLVVSVSASDHLMAANACAYLVEEIRSRIPIWKQEQYEDGSAQWLSGNPSSSRPSFSDDDDDDYERTSDDDNLYDEEDDGYDNEDYYTDEDDKEDVHDGTKNPVCEDKSDDTSKQENIAKNVRRYRIR